MQSFRSFHLSPILLENLIRSNILIPTEIQHKSFQLLTSGQNALIHSETGSGKTLSFILPMIQQILQTPNKLSSPFGLLIAPTHDLSLQMHQHLQKFTEGSGITSHLLTSQLKESLYMPKHQDIIVSNFSTLAQLSHLIPNLFKETQMVAIDEADWVFGDGYRNYNAKPLSILDQLIQLKVERCFHPKPEPKLRTKQFIFSCATLPKGPKSARQEIMKRFPHLQMISSSKSHHIPSTLQQTWIRIDNENNLEEMKPKNLQSVEEEIKAWEKYEKILKEKQIFWRERKHKEILNILREESTGGQILIFGNTTKNIEDCFDYLNSFLSQHLHLKDQISLYHLHQNISKEERQKKLEAFAGSTGTQTQVLICGDTLARGFDFKETKKIINLDFPTNVTTFFHRVGRTARAGRVGEVLHLVTPEDDPLAKRIEEATLAFQGQDSALSQLFSRNRSLNHRMKKKKKSQQKK